MTYFNCHAHSIYSTADGHALVRDYVSKLAALGHRHATLTEHGSMGSMPELWRQAQGHGLMPVAGMEAYTTPFNRPTKLSDLAPDQHERFKKSHHLTLMAINRTGYRNLLALSHIAWGEGFYMKPRIDRQAMLDFSDGVVCLSGCLASELSQAILREDEREVMALLDFYQQAFPDRFFLELQNHGKLIPDQIIVNRRLLELARKHGIPAVGTNDSHFCDADDATAQRYLLDASPKTRNLLSSPYTYVRDNDEMVQAFGDSALVRNTLAIAEMCEPYDLGDKRPKLPCSPLNNGQPVSERMRSLAEDHLMRRLGLADSAIEMPAVYRERLEYELGVLRQMSKQLDTDYEEYLFIMADLTREARRRRIRYGPRGSAAGSLICWALGISELDPVRHDLYFERFLNPERVSLPDIDLDIADDRRQEIFAYLKQTYGKENVGRIVTYGAIGPKMAIWDACRILGKELSRDSETVARELTQLVPHTPNPKEQTLESVLEEEGSRLQARIEIDADARKVIEKATLFANRFKSSGTHAGGVVIADRALRDLVPVMGISREKQKTDPIVQQVQFDMNELEDLGLLKLDILGLSELSKMEQCLELIEKRTGKSIDLWKLDVTDRASWDVINDGDTLGLFQLGGWGMTRALLHIRPRSIEELAMLIAIYRPGPMENLDLIARRKRGSEPVTSLDPTLDHVLAPTFGVPVYQEQVIRIVEIVSGMSRGQADEVRRAMGKKDVEKLAKKEKEFMAGARTNGYSKAEASLIWSQIKPFAGYGFNKAHAFCYAFLGFQSAWLKAHYPIEFYTASLNVEARKGGNADFNAQEMIGALAVEMKRRGIEILPPSIDDPCVWFEPRGDEAIRFGLCAIKGLGEKAAVLVTNTAPYPDIRDLLLRCKANKAVLERLARVGALPWGNRAEMLHAVEDLHTTKKRLTTVSPRKSETKEQAARRAQDRLAKEFTKPYEIEELPELGHIERLLDEHNHLGIPLSKLPFSHGVHRTASIARIGEYLGENVTVAGMLVAVEPFVTKNKKLMARGRVMDHSGSIEFLIWPNVWKNLETSPEPGCIVSLWGQLDFQGDGFVDIEETPPPSLLKLKVNRLTVVEASPLTAPAVPLEDASCSIEPETAATENGPVKSLNS